MTTISAPRNINYVYYQDKYNNAQRYDLKPSVLLELSNNQKKLLEIEENKILNFFSPYKNIINKKKLTTEQKKTICYITPKNNIFYPYTTKLDKSNTKIMSEAKHCNVPSYTESYLTNQQIRNSDTGIVNLPYKVQKQTDKQKYSLPDTLQKTNSTDSSSSIPLSILHYKNSPQNLVTADIASATYHACQVATNAFFSGTDDIYSNIHALTWEQYPDSLHKYIIKKSNSLHHGAVQLCAYQSKKEPHQIYLVFNGLGDSNFWPGVNFIIKNLIGYEGSEFDFADHVVKCFINMYSDKLITLIGHSMGGGFSSYCSIKNDIPAVNFNAMGLSPRLLKTQMKKSKNELKIVHINAKNDWLTQKLQRDFLTQPGCRYLVKNFDHHAPVDTKGNFMADKLYYISKSQA